YAAQGLSISSRDLEGNLILSEAYFQQGNYQEAYAQLLSIKYLYPRNRDLLVLTGKVMSERNQHEDAITALMQAKENGASSGDLFYYLARSLYALDRFADAEKYFQMALYKDRGDTRSMKGLAETEFMRRNYDKSLEDWRKAERLAPDDMEIQLGIAMVLINTRRPEAAVTVLRQIAGRSDSPPRTLYYLGHALMRTGDKSGAKEAFLEFRDTWEGDRALIREVDEILITLE
ncbi:MAG TPA: tetratricopeptide repeat protein, partial [Candidatus Krumholzibacterium sp.]|nr:tetratricopeptide repeat protein [Candidatus Krumholzibacterium sp.]